MNRISSSEGIKLMHKWGLIEWPSVDAEYWLWDGCCIFAIMYHGEIADMHMAMERKRRGESDTAAAEMISIIESSGVREIRALIDERKAGVCRLAVKMGFRFNSIFNGVSHSGAESRVIDMRRVLWAG